MQDLDDRWFFQADSAPGRLFDTRAFKRHLDHFALPPASRAQVFTRLEDYRVHLLNRLGQLKDSFPAKIVKGLAFSPLTDIRSFVHNYLLDENLLDVKTLQAQLDTLRHFESLAADVRERIETLEHIEELDKERAANRRRRITNGYIARRSRGEIYTAELKNARLKLDEIRLELSRAEIQREQLASHLKYAETALLDAKIALQTDQTAIKQRDLTEKLAALDAELALLRQRQTDTDAIIAQEQADAKKQCKLLNADHQEIPAAIESFPTENVNCTLSRNIKHHSNPYPKTIPANKLSSPKKQTPCAKKPRAWKTKSANCAPATATSVTKAKPRRPVTCADCCAPNSAFPAKKSSSYAPCSTSPIKNGKTLVEGILGRNRFAILVPPAHYDAAMKLYRDRRHKDNLHGVALLDTERILSNKAENATYHPEAKRSGRNTLSSEVATDNPAARALIDLLLGHYIKCDTLEELRDHRTAVTRECFMRRNYTDSHINPQVYGRWFIGERAVTSQVESRQQRLDEIAKEMISLNERDAALQERLALTRDKIRPLIDLEHALEALIILPERTTQHETLTKELDPT